jgi:predicted  nucleic acid-binding Zn-ribbon protein
MVVKRIITQSADIMVEVESIDKAKASLETLITNSGGYITNSNSYESRYNASVKVPSNKLQATLNKISKLGNKLSQSISQNDVTNQFVDNEARLKNLILFRDKMQKLLNQTTNIQEIVKIEKEIRRVQIEIDSLKGRQKYLKDAVALSPISVDFKEKTIYGPIGYIVNGLWWVTKKLFVIR